MTAMPPVVWQEAEGFLVRDPFGNQWIDLTSGIVVANAGHGHSAHLRGSPQGGGPQVADDLCVSFTDSGCNCWRNWSRCRPVADAKAILFSAGTEATECAMALMRRHGRTSSPERVGILSFSDGFHGRTLAANMAGGRPGPNDWIAREQVGHYQVPFPFCMQCPWGHERYRQCGAICFGKCLESLRERRSAPSGSPALS